MARFQEDENGVKCSVELVNICQGTCTVYATTTILDRRFSFKSDVESMEHKRGFLFEFSHFVFFFIVENIRHPIIAFIGSDKNRISLDVNLISFFFC